MVYFLSYKKCIYFKATLQSISLLNRDNIAKLVVQPQTIKKPMMVFVNCSIVSLIFKDLSKEMLIGNFLNSTVEPSENFFTEV
jgi:hypothetical protein